VSVQSVSAIGHPGASGARSGGDHPEGVSWGYVRVVHARWRRKGTRPRRLGGSSVLEAGVCPYFLAVPDHGHVLWSRVLDLCLFSDISDITVSNINYDYVCK
jgi:hypothetical protein